MIENSQLLVLLALDQSISLSQAAEVLGITQSAVSQNLKTLEQKVGFSVVKRQGKNVFLTPGGKKLAKLGKTYNKKFEDLINELSQEKKKMVGSISVGTMFGIGKSWIAQRMIEFSTHFPDIKVKFTMDFPDKILNSFENHELDCLVLPSTLVPAHCNSKTLHNEKAMLIFPNTNDFNITKETPLKELVELPLIFFEEKDYLFHHWCRQVYGTVPKALRPRIVMNSFGQILHAVSMGLGVAVVPTHVYNRFHQKELVQTLGPEMNIHTNVLDFIYHTDDSDSLKINTLYDFLQKEVQRLMI